MSADEQESPVERPHADAETVEQVVRAQLSKALGGRRGMAEAAVPTILFTAVWLILHELQLALFATQLLRTFVIFPDAGIFQQLAYFLQALLLAFDVKDTPEGPGCVAPDRSADWR